MMYLKILPPPLLKGALRRMSICKGILYYFPKKAKEMQKSLSDILATLNPEQLEAVETIYGPVLVIA